jgi:hypothetical protein
MNFAVRAKHFLVIFAVHTKQKNGKVTYSLQ